MRAVYRVLDHKLKSNQRCRIRQVSLNSSTVCLIFLLGFCCLLMFSGIASAQEPITIYLAGDSTMAHKLPEKRPETGWGEALPEFFKGNRVRFENHAQNGRSTRTFIEEKRWQAIVDKLKKGDYV